MLFLLSALGFTTACENEDKGTVCMYGTPLIDFELQGSVTDQKGSPIPGIEDRTGEASGSWNRGGVRPFGRRCVASGKDRRRAIESR